MMSKLITLFFVFTFTNPVMALEVHSAYVDIKSKTLELGISYTGGCIEHTFDLLRNFCLKSNPMKCSAQIIDTTAEIDSCDSIVVEYVQFSLPEYGLSKDIFEDSIFYVYGSDKSNKIRVTLP